MDKYNEIVNKLEEEELESTDENVYKKLFAYYLLQDKLIDAKLLWKRLPGTLKDQPEMQRLEILRQYLTTENTFEFFKNLEFEWSPVIAPVLQELKDKIRRGVLDLVGSAYTTIFEKDLCHMTNMTREELKAACKELEWTYEQNDCGENGGAMNEANRADELIIIPKALPCGEEAVSTSESQLEELTEFVSFLEN